MKSKQRITNTLYGSYTICRWFFNKPTLNGPVSMLFKNGNVFACKTNSHYVHGKIISTRSSSGNSTYSRRKKNEWQ